MVSKWCHQIIRLKSEAFSLQRNAPEQDKINGKKSIEIEMESVAPRAKRGTGAIATKMAQPCFRVELGRKGPYGPIFLVCSH